MTIHDENATMPKIPGKQNHCAAAAGVAVVGVTNAGMPRSEAVDQTRRAGRSVTAGGYIVRDDGIPGCVPYRSATQGKPRARNDHTRDASQRFDPHPHR
ncbi:hypothetical protein [Burkholderia perseverans]|uniref:hypothetical protein n=1 Tax=Burkholderia perseverans TaxID=2615214 RepID=UPI001FEF1454|nr:hypothetical protein [Burkholderia perseverans]